VREARAGDGPLCDMPDARWFQMTSEAPALDHGRGIRRRVSAEFSGVENFAGVFPATE